MVRKETYQPGDEFKQPALKVEKALVEDLYWRLRRRLLANGDFEIGPDNYPVLKKVVNGIGIKICASFSASDLKRMFGEEADLREYGFNDKGNVFIEGDFPGRLILVRYDPRNHIGGIPEEINLTPQQALRQPIEYGVWGLIKKQRAEDILNKIKVGLV